jgi:hypothetical protein
MAGKWIPPKMGPSIDKNNFYLILFHSGEENTSHSVSSHYGCPGTFQIPSYYFLS